MKNKTVVIVIAVIFIVICNIIISRCFKTYPIFRVKFPYWITSNHSICSRFNGNDNITIQATIDKESIKNDNIKLPSSSDLQNDLNNGSFTYEELVQLIFQPFASYYSILLQLYKLSITCNCTFTTFVVKSCP